MHPYNPCLPSTDDILYPSCFPELAEYPMQEQPQVDLEMMNFESVGGFHARGGWAQDALNYELDQRLPHHYAQQPPMDRYVAENLSRPLFDVPQPASFRQLTPRNSQHLSYPLAPAAIPFANPARVASPALSHGMTSTQSSGQSPAGDFDHNQEAYYAPESQPHGRTAYFQPGRSGQSQPFNNFARRGHSKSSQTQIQAGGNNCVNMSEVQVIADYDDDAQFEVDEGYSGVQEQEQHHGRTTIKAERSNGLGSGSYYTNEGIGASVRDLPTPNSMALSHHEHENSLMDEDDEEELYEEASTPASDFEYSPKSKARARQRKSRTAPARANPLAANNNDSRVSKNTHKVRGSQKCKQCDATAFKDKAALAKHIIAMHTRAFACLFDFAGCKATFGSKNEWKRHVATQHLNLIAWVCRDGDCSKKHNASEFNRKDLFTQHVRRMHLPMRLKKHAKAPNTKTASDKDFEEHLKKLQVECQVIKRAGPKQLKCPVAGCTLDPQALHCDNALDERMEHVGKHIEKGEGRLRVVNEGDDLLVAWALQERIVEQEGGGYKLFAGAGASVSVQNSQYADAAGSDEDAEGEEE